MTEQSASLSFHSMGLDTYKVPKDLFRKNREKMITYLQEKLSEIAPSQKNDEFMVYLEGGASSTRFDSDHEPIFRQESYFHYLFGVREPDHCGAVFVKSRKSLLFTPELPRDYATIMGHIPTLEEIKETYQVDDVIFTKDIEKELVKFCSNGGTILLLKGTNSDSGKDYIPPTFTSREIVTDDSILFPVLAECRVIKSKMELDLIRYCTEITSLAHAFTMKNMKPGMMEYQGESLFRHFVYYYFGARHVGYTPICGCGPNGAVLHYGHAGAPNNRQLQNGDICLFDMGAEYMCYGSDVTCSFPISSSGKFSAEQRIVYEGVLNAQRAVILMLKPGVSWSDCHLVAEREIIKALVKLDIVVPGKTSTVDDLVEMRLGAVFMPHGLGHFIGIDTHDVGGYLPGHPERLLEPGLRSLRTARVLKSGMTLTVEPGCYFINHLIDEAIKDGGKFKEFLNIQVLNDFRNFGGIRLEDVVAITEDGCENFTVCPRTVAEVEHVMNGGRWPPLKDDDVALKRTRLTKCGPMPFSMPI
jgi:Xaa-Pro dipeptidase